MTGLRITAGSLKGRKVPVPPRDVRPTSGKARQAFFDILGPSIRGARFLDLFSGSGIFSLEAISRGAAEAVAVDISSRASAQIERIAREWDLPVRAMKCDARIAIARLDPASPFDVIYCDPPYDYSSHHELLVAIDRSAPMASDALVAIEHRSSVEISSGPDVRRIRFRKTVRYGEVAISLFDAAPPEMEEAGIP